MADFKLVELKDAGGESFQSLMDLDGVIMCTFMRPPDVAAAIIQNIVNLEIRDDDVMLCTPAKSGTHWGFEIISMLLKGKAETIPEHKEFFMLEAVPQSDLQKMPSPRVLNSHLNLSRLPKQLKEKKTKIILVLRNPKDMSVSFYHHNKGIRFYEYNGKFEDYLPLFLKGELEYGDWFDYALEFEREMDKGDYNIHLVYFEDLKENGLEEIKKIAKFLDVPQNDELCKAIYEKCIFIKMAVDKAPKGELAEKVFKENFSMYRKGQIGDWKNYYTVAMSEQFDKVYDQRMKDSKLKFTYNPSL